jgi:hypothetical protein
LKQIIRSEILLDIYRGINKFKKGYQPRTDLVKDENSYLLAVSQGFMNRWRNYICQLLNVHGINNVRQNEIHTAEPYVPKPSSFGVEIATETLKGN